MLFNFLLFGVIGLGMEVLFTSVVDHKQSRNNFFIGHSSSWYFPLYGSFAIFMEALSPFIFPLHLVVRGLIYTTYGFVLEYLGMGLLRWLFRKSPTQDNYYKLRFNIRGLIALEYIPAYFVASMIFELIFRICQL